jgi:prepilin-type N-terminal cleavage/methylation domain-containing protein
MLLPFNRLTLGKPARVAEPQGFTLIELIVVTALIGILLAISVPSLRNTVFTDPLKSTTRKMIGLVTGVRELAVRSQQSYLLHISQLENRIWYEAEIVDKVKKENDPLKGGELLLPESVRISGVWTEGDDDSSDGQIDIWINKQGFLSDTIIRIEDSDRNHLNVQFYPFLKPAIVPDQVVPP